MGKRATTSRMPPVPFGSERFASMSHDEIVATMAVPHLSRAALWRLVAVGPEAAPAVRAGLRSEHAAVRRGCCELVEHWPDPEALPQLEALLSDPDADVRRAAAHTLTCEHCRDGTWATKRLRARMA